MIKAIIFDLDDTLLDWSKQDLAWYEFHQQHTSLVAAFVREHISPIEADDDSICAKMIELTRAAWQDARSTLRAPHIGHILMDTFLSFGILDELLDMEHLIDAYQWSVLPNVEPFPDVSSALNTFADAGLKMGLVTNSFQPMRVRLSELEAFDLARFFEADHMISAADVGYLKPHPHIFNAALERLGVEASEVIFVGDSREADILGAKNVGMKAVLRIHPDSTAILNGKITPDARILSLYDLYPLLDQWSPHWR